MQSATKAQFDTIAAVATAPGRGGIGVIRISGSIVKLIGKSILQRSLPPRQAILGNFLDDSGETIDQGIGLFFPSPASYTGEDVLELQAHGSPVVLDLLLKRVISLGARLACPGEFTERAFHNGKLDLTQAEAVADLIASNNQMQAKLARRTLQGAFASSVSDLQALLTRQRVLIEAGLDFSDEDLEPTDIEAVDKGIVSIIQRIDQLSHVASQGERVRDGMTVVIVGPPNSGKSSLLNQISGQQSAIVTPIAGTTRDLVRADIQLDGMPLHVIDTAGIRNSCDFIEQEGIRRALEETQIADLVLWVYDGMLGRPEAVDLQRILATTAITLVRNKIDLLAEQPNVQEVRHSGALMHELSISAKTGLGLGQLKEHIKKCSGYEMMVEGAFMARRRHLVCLEQTRNYLVAAKKSLSVGEPAEILAEDLREAQMALSRITGDVSSDDLLGEIFSSFCIGK
ncbi:tRNA modification GTPase MnmE [Thiorhodovibrio winogradskyi]|uniref:tRNA modification GTPase MnmE n=1 Tax=Thiorhodovibrio winogradskyi TaxID=77007 RepID=A0ABZ0SH33_9GAMM|nr:tRNA uridine-5-carboxymethylaminomethyl(34) synthesis GTPase MnmE [Thiorhodovibrio winogradskyi]